jgi:anaerobic selenocysteine-containing dehydrogenase
MRAVAILPAVTGAWRDVGGGLARSTQVFFETALNYPTTRSQSRRQFNMARLGELLVSETLQPRIHALVVHNSNPAVILPDQNRVVDGLRREDLFTLVIEQFMTDTASYADIVLPATTQLEHLDLGIAWGHLYLSLNKPAIRPMGEALPNTEIFRRLAALMNIDDPLLKDDDESLIRQLLDSDHPWLEDISYELLAESTWARLKVPIDFRPYVDTTAETADGRLRLGALSFELGEETRRVDSSLRDRFPLALMTSKEHPKFLNANYAGFDQHLPPEGEPLLQIHPDDALARNIEPGEKVVVFNDRGALTLTVQISDKVLAGMVAIPFGWLHRHSPERRAVNALTNPTVPDDDLGSPAYLDTLVEVRPLHPGEDHSGRIVEPPTSHLTASSSVRVDG